MLDHGLRKAHCKAVSELMAVSAAKTKKGPGAPSMMSRTAARSREVKPRVGGGDISRASLRFEKMLNFLITIDIFPNRSEAFGVRYAGEECRK